MGNLIKLYCTLELEQLRLKETRFLSRYYLNPEPLSLNDHYQHLTQLQAIHAVFHDLYSKNPIMKELPMNAQQVYFQNKMIERDLEFMSSHVKKLKAELLPETIKYVEYLKELHNTKRYQEFFAHFLLRLSFDFYDYQTQLSKVSKLYFRTIPNYKGDNYGLSYYYLPKYCEPNFETWYANLKVEESEIEPHVKEATQTMQDIYSRLEVERNKKPKAFCTPCRFFTATVVASVSAASTVFLTAKYLN